MKTVYIPKGETVHYESLTTEHLVVHGRLHVTYGIKAQSITGSGVIDAGSINADTVCIDDVESGTVICKRLIAKRVQAPEVFASESAAVSCFLSAAYVETGKLTAAISEVDEVVAQEVVNLTPKKRTLFGTLFASMLRSFWTALTVPRQKAEVLDAEFVPAQEGHTETVQSEGSAEFSASDQSAPEVEEKQEETVDEELNRIVGLFTRTFWYPTEKHWEILSAGGSIMAQLNPKEMQQALAKPFAPEDLEWRLQNTTEEKMRGLAVPYVTNRAIQNRLDEVCGPENWYNDFKPWHSNGKKEAQLCGIAIYFEGRGFITKWDGAEDSDIESVKGGLSDSMKRAAVQWGIGRVLYDLNTVWVEIEKRGRSFVIKDSERARLDNAYLSALKRLGLTPAAACGIQSLLTPKTLPGQTAPEENAPAANPQPKQGNSQPTPASALQRADRPTTRSDSQQTPSAPQSRAAASRTVPFALPQSAARQRTDCYVVLSTKVQGGMSGSSTLVTLRAPDGKQIPAFARGARPELSTGTVLSNVKLTMRQQDTVAFYVLESYEIVPQEDRAA